MPTRECTRGWIAEYLDYTRPQQSPTIFHTWTAISTIGSALRRRVWLDRSYYILHPNLYTILISPPGIGMKTSAIKIGTEILAKAVPDLAIMRGALTIGYLAEWMQQAGSKHPKGDAEVTVFCEEFKVFSKGLYAESGLIENLTKLYDCGVFDYRTKGQGIYIVERPCVNILAAATPETLSSGQASEFIGGGFSSRIVPVALVKDEKLVANPKKPPTNVEMETKLLHDLTQISQLSGPFFATKGSEDLFEKWYIAKEKYQMPDQRMSGYYAKKQTLVWKVAMILSTSLNDDLVITEEHIESALALLGKLELTIPFAFQGVAWGEQAKFQDRVLGKILDTGCIEHSTLLSFFHYCMTGANLKEIIHTLFDENKICCERVATRGKPKVVYVTEEFIKKEVEKEGLAKVKQQYPSTWANHPEWFEPVVGKKNGGKS